MGHQICLVVVAFAAALVFTANASSRVSHRGLQQTSVTDGQDLCPGAVNGNENPVLGCRCGPNAGERRCKQIECCSVNGWCGRETDHCVKICNPKYGACGEEYATFHPAPLPHKTRPDNKTKLSNPALNEPCGPRFDLQCEPTFCCSKSFYCGVSPAHCEAGCQEGWGQCAQRCGQGFPNTTCPPGLCCSRKSFCGNTAEHCNMEKGCDERYGKCDPAPASHGNIMAWPPERIAGVVVSVVSMTLFCVGLFVRCWRHGLRSVMRTSNSCSRSLGGSSASSLRLSTSSCSSKLSSSGSTRSLLGMVSGMGGSFKKAPPPSVPVETSTPRQAPC